MWNKIRKNYQDRINHYEKNIEYNLKQWTLTNKLEHKLFADHDIKQLNELRNYILQREKELGLY